MIFVDVKIFGSDNVINMMLDEGTPSCGIISCLRDYHESGLIKSEEPYFILSVRNKAFLLNDASLESQGIKGGDRLLLIRKEDDVGLKD